MNRGKSGEIKIRKKSTFRPIMITSNSIKPIDRSNIQKAKPIQKPNYPQPSSMGGKQQHQYATYAGSLNRSEIIKKLTEEYREELIKNIRDECNSSCVKNKKYKQFVTSVVHVEFERQEKNRRSQSKYENRYDSLGASNGNITNNNQMNNDSLRKYFYCTNSRAFEGFFYANKNRMNHSVGFGGSNLVRSLSSKDNDEWNKRIDKTYLNVKKISPLDKKKDHQYKLSEEKLNQISLKVQQYNNDLIRKMQHRHKINSSCLDNISENRSESPVLKSAHKNIIYSDRQRIEADILTKRQTTKKEHFVFSLSEITKINPQQVTKQKFEIYKDFLWKVNFSNSLYVYVKDEIQYPYKLYVGPGNNSMLIKGIMKRRFWWQVVDKCSQQVNFVWTQIKINEFFKYQTSNTKREKNVCNLAKMRKVQSAKGHINKSTLEQNLDLYKKIEKNLQFKKEEETDKHNKIFKGKDYTIWQNHYNLNKKHEDKIEGAYPKRIKSLIRKKHLIFVEENKNMKVQNHFECNYFLGNKKALFYYMKKYYNLLGKDPFQHIPLTFHIAKGMQDQQYHKFIEKYQYFQQKKKAKQCQNIWIVKPGQMTNRGRGITVCSILDDVKVRLKSKQKAKNGQLHTYIVQKYIEKPLLYYKRKFDIRHYMLMTCVNGKFKGYWYEEGYLRTTSYQYSIKNCKDLYTHLTNDAIQKYSADYGKFEKGNKVSYADFQKYLNTNYRNKNKNIDGVDKYDFYGYVLPQMKNLATDAMKATYMFLSPQRYQHNFQLFGLDFMLDEDMNVYLIEVNTNPCLQTSCPLLSKLISSVVENMLKICVDPLFPPPYQWPNQKKMQMGENALDQNRFVIVFDENQEGDQLLRLYENAENNEDNMGAIDEQDQFYEDQGKQWVEEQK